MSLYLLHCRPDLPTLTTWATRRRLLSPDGDDGYAVHALLAAAFGERAPKPFRHLGGRGGLLAYTETDPGTLLAVAAAAAPEVARSLGLAHLATRPFPGAWRAGQPLAFEVRVRPVLRAADGRERDLFLHSVETRPESAAASRAGIYGAWLRRQCAEGDAAVLGEVRMEAFRLSRVVRRAAADARGPRPACAPCGPDVVLAGELRVGDGAAFNRLLARGIGRHRAFGFGMLLLRPAQSC